jgi:tetratricopeptide (TPR) repeat protein
MTIDQTNSNDTPRKAWRIRLAAVAVCVCSLAVLWWNLSHATKIPEGLSDAHYRLAANKWQLATGRTPNHIETLMMAGELAIQRNDLKAAVAAFGAVPDDHSQFGNNARFQEAQVMVRLNLAHDAERSFRRFLVLSKGDPKVPQSNITAARKWLSFLLSVQLRLDERSQVLAAAHESRQIDLMDSKQYFFPRLLIWNESTGRTRLNDFLRKDNTNLLLNISLARYLTGEGKLSESRTILADLVKAFPDHPACKAAVLECCFEQNDWAAIAQILKTPESHREHELHLISALRGELALHEGRWADAIQEFQRALKSDASDPAVHMGLAKAYGKLDQAENQMAAQQRSLILSRIRVGMARVTEQSAEAARELAEMCEQIDMTKAAEIFRWHSDRIASRLQNKDTAK